MKLFHAAAATATFAPSLLDDTSRKGKAALAKQIASIIDEEGPVLIERLIRIVLARAGLTRLTASRRNHLLALVPRDLVRQARNGDLVAWPKPLASTQFRGYRVPGDPRGIAEIPYHELRNALVDLLRRSGDGLPSDEALHAVATTFGIATPTAVDRDRLAGVLAGAQAEGQLS